MFTKEDIPVFSYKENWLKLDDFDERFIEYLMPHSGEYFSQLNNLYLFQVKDLSMLNYLGHIFSRDGILPLVKFFWDNPSPGHFFKNIIIHESCFFTVPKAWNENMLFYRDKSLVPTGPRPTKNKLFLSGLANSDCINIDIMKKRLNTSIEQYDFEKVYLGLYRNNWSSFDQHLEDDGTYFKITQELLAIFGEKLEFVTWGDVISKSFQDCYFHDLCTSPFWYNDSYVKYAVLSRGAEYLNLKTEVQLQDEKLIHFEQLSPYHGYEIFQGKHRNQQIAEKDLEEQHGILKTIINNDEVNLNRSCNQSTELQICTDNLKSFAHYLSNKYEDKELV